MLPNGQSSFPRGAVTFHIPKREFGSDGGKRLSFIIFGISGPNGMVPLHYGAFRFDEDAYICPSLVVGSRVDKCSPLVLRSLGNTLSHG